MFTSLNIGIYFLFIQFTLRYVTLEDKKAFILTLEHIQRNIFLKSTQPRLFCKLAKAFQNQCIKWEVINFILMLNNKPETDLI